MEKTPAEFLGMRKHEPQANQFNDLLSYSRENNLSSEEMSVAYQIALGAISPGDEETKNMREEVFSIAQKMDDYMKDGLSVNKITKLIDAKEDYEKMVDIYHDFVDGMKIKDKEKKVLKSIVDNKRSGTLMVLDLKTLEELGGVEITDEIVGEKYSKNDLAAILFQHLLKYKNKEIGITFSE